jgi:hypothetical protein
MSEVHATKLTFIFWNVARQPLKEQIARLAVLHSSDVLMVAEVGEHAVDVLLRLNREYAEWHLTGDSHNPLITVFSRFPSRFLRTIEDGARYTVRRLMLPDRPDLLLVIAHLPSKLHYEPADRVAAAEDLAATIRRVESRMKHDRTLLVGDLNMDPYDEGVVKARGIHGVMTRSIARSRFRMVQSRQFPYFYNPMWGLYQDRPVRPPATFYRSPSGETAHMWHMYDQVLVRPSLLDQFSNEDLAILHTDGDSSLISERGIPSKRVASDHLPILFKLTL